MVLTTAMACGTRAAAWLAVGLAVGLGFWGLVAAAGLGALLVQSSVALTILRWCGGAYLVWLGLQSARSAIAPEVRTESIAHVSGGKLLLRGLVLNLSNPKAVLAWISVLAIGASSTEGGSRLVMTTALCAVLGLAIYLVYAVLFSQASVRSGYRQARRAIEGMAAAFFGYSGLKLLLARPEAT